MAHVLDIPLEVVWKKSRRPQVAVARSLLCYWASKELAISMTELEKRFNLTQPAVSVAGERSPRKINIS